MYILSEAAFQKAFQFRVYDFGYRGCGSWGMNECFLFEADAQFAIAIDEWYCSGLNNYFDVVLL